MLGLWKIFKNVSGAFRAAGNGKRKAVEGTVRVRLRFLFLLHGVGLEVK